jgi:HD superfamily phosphohydrolase
MFSHAFEDIGKSLNLKMAHHETVSDLLIRDSEVGEVLKKDLGSGFANDVADVIKRDGPGNLYDAVVSSQFDADRLDYAQRDRFMTGVQNSGIDFTWLINNLEIGAVAVGVDEQSIESIETFVLGPKAVHAAEAYVLSLFQLYPTVYLHKATRGAEKVFSALMTRVIELARQDHSSKINLPINHPLVRFAKDADSIKNALALDDTVFCGALPLLVDAEDKTIADCARALYHRRLPKCIDIREQLASRLGLNRSSTSHHSTTRTMEIDSKISPVKDKLQAWSMEKSASTPRILFDKTVRAPYKRFSESKGPLNQIRIRTTDGHIFDVAEFSRVVAGIEDFQVFRAYVDDSDTEAKSVIDDCIKNA